METTKGTILLELYPDEAPIAVQNFIDLIRKRFYDGLTFHRIEDFVAQGGDPKGDGTGGPGYTIKSEVNSRLQHARGALGMANSGRDTAGSQFYIVKKGQLHPRQRQLYALRQGLQRPGGRRQTRQGR